MENHNLITVLLFTEHSAKKQEHTTTTEIAQRNATDENSRRYTYVYMYKLKEREGKGDI